MSVKIQLISLKGILTAVEDDGFFLGEVLEEYDTLEEDDGCISVLVGFLSRNDVICSIMSLWRFALFSTSLLASRTCRDPLKEEWELIMYLKYKCPETKQAESSQSRIRRESSCLHHQRTKIQNTSLKAILTELFVRCIQRVCWGRNDSPAVRQSEWLAMRHITQSLDTKLTKTGVLPCHARFSPNQVS